MMGPSADEILASFPGGSPPADTAGAAVFIVLRAGRRDVETLLIQRATREDDPASGQVSLPGGHVDPSDTDLRATALRELEEEVGLRRSDLVEPIRYIDTLEAKRFAMSVGIFAASLAPGSAPPTSGSPREVASIFWLPRRALARRTMMVVETPRGRLELPSVQLGGHVVWGFTLRVLDGLLGPRSGPRTAARSAKEGAAPSVSKATRERRARTRKPSGRDRSAR
jgi:8-oxo-dGTP pyrophosphatase MutT (NUDIX family)